MIESNIPEIDVNELVKQVQLEAKRLSEVTSRQKYDTSGAASPLRPPSALRSFPGMAIPLEADLGADQLATLHTLLERARQAAELSPRIPKPFRKIFSQQDQYNAFLIQSVIPLFESVNKLIHSQRQLFEGLHVQNVWLAELSRARGQELDWMRKAGSAVGSLNQNLEQIDASAKAIHQKLEVDAVDKQAVQDRLTGVQDCLTGVQDRLTGVPDRLAALQDRLTAAQQTITSLQESLAATQQNVASAHQNLSLIDERYTHDASFIKAQLSLQANLIRRRLDGAPISDDARPHGEAPSPEQTDRRLDALYLSFENRFRGSREEIKKRVRFYLPVLEKAQVGSEGKPILDLGCGRGEWLEVLREQGLAAAGVDLNEAMIAQCSERQLNVHQADAVRYLRNLKDGSLGAVTGFHIIEHLSLETLVDLLGETMRVLHPGGVAIFETPNCKNLIVGASNFNIDPTHQRPVFPETAQFMLEIQGFEHVRLEYLAPVPIDAAFLETLPIPIRELLYGPQDFAVIGYKSAAN
ncbi:MAG TPA: methyltransferase domain-containing protein [Chthoniobacterales bacterium]|jgi:O-antigen chain-terminating methyltransferase